MLSGRSLEESYNRNIMTHGGAVCAGLRFFCLVDKIVQPSGILHIQTGTGKFGIQDNSDPENSNSY